MLRLSWSSWVLGLWIAAGCGGSNAAGPDPGPDPDPQPPPPMMNVCGPWPDQAMSPHILPYPPGVTRTVTQGNCSTTFGHRPEAPASRHAYDFGMPIGSPLLATRDGVVLNLFEGGPDGTGQPQDNNALWIRHPDDSVSFYDHLTMNGVLVEIGQAVSQGDTVALSGNSGPSSGPHLHYGVWRRVGDPTSIPLTFRNTRPHPNGLQVGQSYRADPF